MKKKGFTLLEILVVLILVSLLFGVVLLVEKNIGGGSLQLKKDAEELKNQVFLMYLLRHQLEAVRRKLVLKQDEDNLYLGFITCVGNSYQGVVKVRYRFSKGKLFYCENFYTFDDVLSCPNGSEMLLGHFKNFQVKIFYRGKWYDSEHGFSGLPEKVKITFDNNTLISKLWIGKEIR